MVNFLLLYNIIAFKSSTDYGARNNKKGGILELRPFALCQKPFYFITTECTVDLLVPRTFAQARTVQPVSTMYLPSLKALSSIYSHIRNSPFFDKRYLLVCRIKGNYDYSV